MRPIPGKSRSVFASQTLPMNPVTPISNTCLPASAERTESGWRWRACAKCTTGRGFRCTWRSAATMADCNTSRLGRSSSRTSRSGSRAPLGPAPVMRANSPRGRITGASSRPVASRSRKSKRLATIQRTPRERARGRITWSRAWLTRTTWAPRACRRRSSVTPSGFRCGLSLYWKNSSPSRSNRSRLTPRNTLYTTRVANRRWAA